MGLVQLHPGMIIWTIITFIALLVILGKFAWKPLLTMLDERQKSIEEQLDKAEKSQIEAEKQLETNKRLIEDSQRKMGEMLEAGKKDAEKLRSDIVEKAKEEASKIIEEGRKQIEREKVTAVQELKGVAADLVLTASEKLIKEKLDEKTHRTLIEGYLKDLEVSH